MPRSNLNPNELSTVETAELIKKLVKDLPDARSDASRLDELRRLFSKTGLKFGQAAPENKAAAKWQSFLLKNHKRMVSQLCDRIEEGRRSSIRCLFGVIASSPLLENGDSIGLVNADLLQKWYQSICCIDPADFDSGIQHMVKSEFIMPYRDIQYYSLGCISRLAVLEHKRSPSSSQSMISARLMELLMMIPSPSFEEQWGSGRFLFATQAKDAALGETSDDSASENASDEANAENTIARPRKRQKLEQNKPSFQQLKSCRREFQKAWIAVLKLPLPKSSMKRALQFLPESVLKCVPNALMFSDFFMEAYKDHGEGVTGVYALEGLFYLIAYHGLEYPNFYMQLYRLISPRVMHAKYRGRFLSLLSKCLIRNELLPAHIVAAFSKRLCRSALSAPPSTVLFVLALVSNLLRKHSECQFLIQRNEALEIGDFFAAEATDLSETQALRTSLWEVVALERHYCASIGLLSRSIGTPEESKLPLHEIEQFLDHTYESLFEMERKKRKKTALAFVKPHTVLTDDDVFFNFLTTEK